MAVIENDEREKMEIARAKKWKSQGQGEWERKEDEVGEKSVQTSKYNVCMH